MQSNSLKNHPLQLNLGSLPPLSADLKKVSDSLSGGIGNRGACLTLNDHDHIRQFIQEFTFRGLLPHIEKNIRQLNDQVLLRVPVTHLHWLYCLKAVHSISGTCFHISLSGNMVAFIDPPCGRPVSFVAPAV